MVGLLLAVTNVDEAEERLGAAETPGKLGHDRVVVNRENTGGMEGTGEAVCIKNNMYKNGVNVR